MKKNRTTLREFERDVTASDDSLNGYRLSLLGCRGEIVVVMRDTAGRTRARVCVDADDFLDAVQREVALARPSGTGNELERLREEAIRTARIQPRSQPYELVD